MAALATLLLLAPGIPAAAAGLGPGLIKGSLQIPNSQLTDWTHSGVQGGIPDTSGWHVVTYDCNGSDDAGALANVINDPSYPDGKIVQLAADDTCQLGQNEIDITRGNVVLRGAAHWKGAGNGGTTILAGNAPVEDSIIIGGSGGPTTSLASNPTAGDTSVTVSSTSHGISVGDWFEVSEQVHNDGYWPDCLGDARYSNYGMCVQNGFQSGAKMEVRKATSVNGATISFTPALRYTYGIAGGYGVSVTKWTPHEYVGLENLYFKSNVPGCNDNNLFRGYLGTSYAVNWWLTGNVFYYPPRWALGTNGRAAHFEISDNIFNGHQRVCASGFDSEYQAYLYRAADSRFINNVALNTSSLVQLQGYSIGNVIAYNYMAPGNLCESAYAVPAGNGSYRAIFFHGAFPSYNLVEGNDLGKCRIDMDNYWGSQGIGNVYFRNRFRYTDESDGSGSTFVSHFDMANNNVTIWDRLGFIGNHLRGAWAQTAGGECNGGAFPYTNGNNGDVNCMARHSWYERNVFWDPHAPFTESWLHRGMVAGVSYKSDMDCGDGTGIAGCGNPDDAQRGTNVQRQPGPPSSWANDTVPKSFYDPSIDQEPWVCKESLNGNRIAIGAWDDDYTKGYSKLPAEIKLEGGTCTAPDGSIASQPPPPPPPLPIPDLHP